MRTIRLAARSSQKFLSSKLYRHRLGRLVLPKEFFPSLAWAADSRLLQDPNAEIKTIVEAGAPAMIARFGSVELRRLVGLAEIRRKRGTAGLARGLVRSNRQSDWKIFRGGQFRALMDDDPTNALKFLEQYEAAMGQVDLLGAWAYGEAYFSQALPDARLCMLGQLEPWSTQEPWSEALKGKKVVCVHPFKESILSQYLTNRPHIFSNPRVLPEFELRVVQAFLPGVRDYPGENFSFFERIARLIGEVYEQPFDVAIIGSGPNGFLIAAEVKRRGQIAVHLGGATQLLFGIRGKRWDETGFPHINGYWTRPLPSETPGNYSEILDGGAYW